MVTSLNHHSCKDFSLRVIQYLDGALSQEDEMELLLEMRKCEHCHKKYSNEKAFREFIKSKVNRRKVSPALVQSIKDKIRLSAI